ncbi:MAG: DHA2 family efflux MFS transporter permease subunit [Anaerolineae bacterium]|nr:DHA2 family efflux MFS transporter permease subunit [Anaerolineae bacterium]
MKVTRAKKAALPEFTRRQGYLILAATIIGAGLVYLDGTIITVALPQIQKDFRASMSNLQWLIDIYILSLTVPILVAGSLSDRYGRKKLFMVGLAGFTTASVACGMATAFNQLIVARIVQGISGAVMLPGSLAILNASFPPAERGKNVGTWSAFTPLATAAGPLLGGWLVDNVSWRAAFYINLPVGLAALLITWHFVPESKSDTIPESQDWPGAGLITAGLGGLIFGLIEGPRRGWADPLVWISIAVSLVCLLGFVVVENKAKHPMIPFSLFKHRTFSGITLVTFVLYFAMSGVFFFLTLNLQQIQKFTATQAGLAFMPIIVLLFLLSRRSGVFADKVGPRLPMIIGPVIIAVGFFMYMLPGVAADGLDFLPATVVFGLGLGITVAPLTAVALGAVPTHLSGLASGVSNAASRVATMLAVAMLGAVMVLQFGASLQEYSVSIPLSEQHRLTLAEEALDLGGAEPPSGLSYELTAAIETVIDIAFVDAFRWMMGLCGVLALGSAVISAFTISNRIVHYHEGEMLPWPELEPALPDLSRYDHAGVEAQLPGVNGHSHYAEWYESTEYEP